MFHPVSGFIGLRYLKGRSNDPFSRFVSYLSTAGITIGVIALITVLSVMNGFEDQLKGRMLEVIPQAIVNQSSDQKIDYTQSAPQNLLALPDVTNVDPVTQEEAIYQSSNALGAGIMVGINGSDDPIAQHMLVGELSQLQAGKYHIVIGQLLANKLNVSVGDKIRLMVTSATQYTPIGRIPNQRNFTVSGIYSSGTDIDGTYTFVNLADAGRLLQYPINHATGWRLFFSDPFAVSSLRAELPDYSIKDWREQKGELFQAVKMERNMMGIMLGLIVTVAAFNIISSLIMVVMEKQGEVAILKTQGMTSKQIMMIFIIQGASSGVIGAIIGGIFGIVIASNINPIISFFGAEQLLLGGSLPVVIEYSQVLFVVLLALCLTVLATLYPSYRAASAAPAEALRYE
ncbi:lipoprotein-releasing ABC transporter permease subunit LolC [Vibrio sp. SS-MA-C1-2]|uniref:lipoprotein-releasing ABC transporter permease subunit LolC n=1 Tax=Vibrio sp. SS-MA-C1-2 TaxID=2908646 RepID=UPI001F223F43|nr:lipoprotein-releasing ABC transporter permease subunit LolC [Vibrio sp. SS-MA-C1-2]UJF17431.1 lipoprotein-releasing ABC transporter permease subunit LolC [Vibrio sp. SS-MA-C1-2]